MDFGAALQLHNIIYEITSEISGKIEESKGTPGKQIVLEESF